MEIISNDSDGDDRDGSSAPKARDVNRLLQPHRSPFLPPPCLQSLSCFKCPFSLGLSIIHPLALSFTLRPHYLPHLKPHSLLFPLGVSLSPR